MIIMLFQLRHVNIGSDDSKDDFNVDKDRSGQLKKLENADCKHYWRKFSIIHFRTCQRIKYWSYNSYEIIHATGKIHKKGKWVSYQLSENAIANRLNIYISLIARQKKKSFCTKLLLKMKNESILIISNEKDWYGLIQAN